MRQASRILLLLVLLLIPFYGVLTMLLAGRPPESRAYDVLEWLVRMPVAEVALFAWSILLAQKAAGRRLPGMAVRFAVSAGVLAVFAMVHTARWFLA